MKRLTMLLVFAGLAAVLLGGYWYWQQPTGVGSEKAAKKTGKGAGKRGGGPVNVSTVIAKRQPMPVVIDAVGTVESEHSVAVRPQTSGVLDAVLFKEGDPVKQGQVLFRIDSRPMTVSVEQARAALARALGDEEARAGFLTEAARRYTEMGAPGYAALIAQERAS